MSFSPFNWIRDILGIRKDIIVTRKTSAELRKLNDEEIARHLLNTATLEQILKYDPNTLKLMETVAEKYEKYYGHFKSGYDDSGILRMAVPIVYQTKYTNIEDYIRRRNQINRATPDIKTRFRKPKL